MVADVIESQVVFISIITDGIADLVADTGQCSILKSTVNKTSAASAHKRRLITFDMIIKI